MYKKGYQAYKISENIEIARDVKKLIISGSFTGQPGQFYMVKAWKSGGLILGRPLSIHNLFKDKIEFLYLVTGKGTKILADLKAGDEIQVMGPLGSGFNLKELNSYGKIALLSGGIGSAPLEYLAGQLTTKFDYLGGFKDQVYLSENLKNKSDQVLITSEDGIQGSKGLVTDVLDEGGYDKIVACGPDAMLRAIYEKLNNKEKLIVSMEARMSCGIGACLGCSCGPASIEAKRVCKEGPVFKGVEVYGM